jgi:hypothetical protein
MIYEIIQKAIEDKTPVVFVVRSLPFNVNLLKDAEGKPIKVSGNPLDMNCLVGTPISYLNGWVGFEEQDGENKRRFSLRDSEIVMVSYLV